MKVLKKLEILFKKILGNIDIGQRVRKKHFIQEVKKIDLSGKTVLDAGCGNGVLILAKK